MSEAPTFENVEDANKYIASNHKPAEPAPEPAPAVDEAKVTELVQAQVSKHLASAKNEQEARDVNVFLGDEDNVTAIKKTFTGEDADKKYDAWHKEVQEGKASFRELTMLRDRGTKVLAAEAKAAEAKAKAVASGVNVPGVTGTGGNENLSPLDAATKMQAIIDDPKRSIIDGSATKEQKEKDQAELKYLSQFIPNDEQTHFARSRFQIAQYHRDTQMNVGKAWGPVPAQTNA